MNADKLEGKSDKKEGRSFVGASRGEMDSSMSDTLGAINLNKEVAKKGNISLQYLSQIRQGTNVTVDNKKNQELIILLIGIYREIGKDKLNALIKVLQEK